MDKQGPCLSWIRTPPELKHLTWQQRDQIGRVVAMRPLARAAIYDVTIILLLLGVVQRAAEGWASTTAIIVGVTLQLVTIAFLLQRVHAARRQILRDVLLSRNIRPAQCFDCHYDLRGSNSVTCPECGSVLLDEAHRR